MSRQAISNLKGFAAVSVVASHAYLSAGYQNGSVLTDLAIALTNGSTIYFVILAGLLFHQGAQRGFDYSAFLRKRAVQIGGPYLFVGLPFATYATLRQPDFARTLFGPWLPDLLQIPALVATGTMTIAYWYVPFLICLLLMAPLHLAFVRLSGQRQAAILVAGLALAGVIHRPVLNMNVVQSLIYFTPVYLVGIWVSVHRDWLWPLLARWAGVLALAAALLAVAQVSVGQHVVVQTTLSLHWQGFDLMILQKTALTLALFGGFLRLGDRALPGLTAISNTCYGVYLLHPVVLQVLIELRLLPHSGIFAVDWVTRIAVLTGVAYGATVMLGLISGRHSRMVIGA